ncbi:hypothetical protein [Natrialba asiatica]|uniref:Flagellin n=1 Tax=Natrialba asiatica (strain ATCC 700177 / DSM 12278 / JCM 9576 / FERM P-10747 / NBRC 102637 / 172P1) TaxID=29540 RepID=M0AKL8_NATA1|nr:hypothetical protein [Natrialba asiatica]ELY98891.1 flagellin [Natrialba asiatica DSM 12278]
MGFSTSGAVLVILVGFLLAVSAIVPTVFSVGAETGEAFAAQNDQFRERQNTAVAIESFEYTDATNETDAIVNVTNEGATSLSVTMTDVVVNGQFYPTQGVDEETAVVVGDAERNQSDVWLPGTHLEIEIVEDRTDDEIGLTGNESEDSVRITTKRGVADSAAITT